jgi:hypothetical protein
MVKVIVTIRVEIETTGDRKGGWLAHADAIRGSARGKNQVDALMNLLYMVHRRPELWEPQTIERVERT